ncbi:hypothetical protein PSACC_00537 [Paramicrosporidium saccamoebae]|uniref:Uncharacterized protein n=1 Tax=Paramicrosporidium saccamoebae TaxID=1246581 RepID=A0A2H9TPL8_9FUNG|nr:hypothetical protein PSACC_00537 [Paramicrosporidium saccamoebae]
METVQRWSLPAGDFYKCAKWSPDGSCILSSAEENQLKVHSINKEDLLTLAEPDSIHDICWYPWMNAQEPATNCFLSCSRDQPIHLWDVSLHKVRCNYVAMDHLDQVATCYSCTFNADGRLVVAGSNKSIHVFDSSVPGRSIVDVAVKTTEAPVSSLSFRRDDTGVLAAGSFAGHIGVYDIRIGEDPSQVMLLAGHSEGVTQVLFDGWNVYSVARKEDRIWQWDLRTSSVVKHFGPRTSTTNQRLYFSLCGTRLMTGDQDGNLIAFDTSSEEAGSIEPTEITKVANTVTSSVSTSAHHPDLVAITVGERSFHISDDTSSDDEIPPEPSHLSLFRIKV